MYDVNRQHCFGAEATAKNINIREELSVDHFAELSLWLSSRFICVFQTALWRGDIVNDTPREVIKGAFNIVELQMPHYSARLVDLRGKTSPQAKRHKLFHQTFIHFIHFFLFWSIVIDVHPLVSSIARVTSAKSSEGIITHQSHISQVSANAQPVKYFLSINYITSGAFCDTKYDLDLSLFHSSLPSCPITFSYLPLSCLG